MKNWQQFFQHRGIRRDLKEDFYPDHWEQEKPLLLNTFDPILAAFISAKVMQVIVKKGGSRLKPSAIDELEKRVKRSIPQEILSHCDREAEKILEWLENPPSLEGIEIQEESKTPELDMM